MTRVVEDLVLVRDRSLAVFGEKYLRPLLAPARCASRSAVEVGEPIDGDDVAASVRVAGPGRDVRERAVFTDQRSLGSRLLKPRQPAVVWPSKSSRQPAFFSAD